MWQLALVVAAGAIGAPARFLLDGFVGSRTDGAFPWGTLAVNLTGSLVLGLVTGMVLQHAIPETPRVVLGIGFCGSYTTFSTFTFETARLFEEGEPRPATANVVATVLGSACAAGLGIWLASVF